MTKMSEPMRISQTILENALQKADGNLTILSEQIKTSYTTARNLYLRQRMPSEDILLKLEKFLSKKNFKPRKTVRGRPKK